MFESLASCFAFRCSAALNMTNQLLKRLFERAVAKKSGDVAEGVGFEPTVGFPTLDFESSALNRTQPPFLAAGENVER